MIVAEEYANSICAYIDNLSIQMSGENMIFSIRSAAPIEQSYEGVNKSSANNSYCIKILIRWIVDLNVNCKRKLQEVNTR